MIVWCGSHTKWYVPFLNFTVHFVVPLDIQGVDVGPFLNPGQSASVTINLRSGHVYTYLCDPTRGDRGPVHTALEGDAPE
jgi:hypothetical protein